MKKGKMQEREHHPKFMLFVAAVASVVTVATTAAIQVFALIVAARRGPLFFDKILAAAATAIFVVGLLYAKHRERTRLALAASCFTAAGAIAFAIALRSLGAESAFARSAAAFLGLLGAAGCGIAVLAALHGMGHAGASMLRFHITTALGIALTIWTKNLAPAMLTAVVLWLMYRHTPAPLPERKTRRVTAEG